MFLLRKRQGVRIKPRVRLEHGEELLYYYPRAVKPCEPTALVYKTFGNDMGFGYSPREVLDLSERVFEYARTDFPGIHIYIHGPEGNHRQSPDRHASNIRKREYDSLLRYYASQHDDCTYFSIMESPLFFHDPADRGNFDKMREDLFVEDGVHFNSQGYELYRQFFKQLLANRLE